MFGAVFNFARVSVCPRFFHVFNFDEQDSEKAGFTPRTLVFRTLVFRLWPH